MYVPKKRIRISPEILRSIEEIPFEPKPEVWERIEVKPPEFMFRLTVCLDFSLHDEYWSVRGQLWRETREEALAELEGLEERVIEEYRDYVGYSRDVMVVHGAYVGEISWGVQRVVFDEFLIGTEEIRVEEGLCG